MKCKGKEHYGKDAKTIVCESTGKKCEGKAVWVDENGVYYERRNSGNFHRRICGKTVWVFAKWNQEYVKANMK